MSISSVASLSSLASSANSANSASSTSAISSSVSMNFTQYLKIITTQLQHQDPTNATDPNQYTQELIQIEQVEVQNNTNTDLESLTKASSANSLATGVGYMGNYVRAPSANGDFSLQSGAAEFGYTLSSAAANTTITIKDSSGSTVATLSGATAAGDNYVIWDGKDASGNTLADGAYTFTVAAADSSGNTVTSSNPTAFFKVTGLQSNSDGTLQLDAGDLSLSTSDVTGVYSVSTMPSGTKATVTG
ncbi:MAG: flagellar biosynthesis protein FlgD [Alphaproteobacteria bacterium]|nr:flagellar biosynthesis protein FlgD [Alphaproteobacteria bacterium]